jgi:hypothetical protein
MSDEDATSPPVVKTVKSIWAWSMAHTMVTACALSFAAGFIVRWLL